MRKLNSDINAHVYQVFRLLAFFVKEYFKNSFNLKVIWGIIVRRCWINVHLFRAKIMVFVLKLITNSDMNARFCTKFVYIELELKFFFSKKLN